MSAWPLRSGRPGWRDTRRRRQGNRRGQGRADSRGSWLALQKSFRTLERDDIPARRAAAVLPLFPPILFSHCCGARRSLSLPGRRQIGAHSLNASLPSDRFAQCRMRIVLPTSMGSPPISPARQTSPIRSPAWVTTMPPPSIQWWTSSNSSFVNPSSPSSR